MIETDRPPLYLHLSRRESQIMDILYRLGEATVSVVVARMPNDPTYNTVRNKLTVMEGKGYVVHRRQGRRYVYAPTEPLKTSRQSVVRHMIDTFYGGSPSNAALALLGMSVDSISENDLDEIQDWIEEARKRSE